jgi:hypothetical protein
MFNTISVNEPDFQISLSPTHTLLGNSTEISLPRLLDSRIIGSVLFSFSGTVDQSIPVSPMQMLHSSAIKTFLHNLTAVHQVYPLTLSHNLFCVSKERRASLHQCYLRRHP